MPIAVGVIETQGFPTVLAAADAMVKAGRVTLVDYNIADSGRQYIAVRAPYPKSIGLFQLVSKPPINVLASVRLSLTISSPIHLRISRPCYRFTTQQIRNRIGFRN